MRCRGSGGNKRRKPADNDIINRWETSKMKMTNDEYKDYTDSHSPRSKSGRNMLRAFLVGGAICLVGQALIDIFMALGIDKETACSGGSISLVFLGALLTWGFMTIWQNLPGRAPWCPSPGLQTRWWLLRWSSRPKASFWARRQRCSSSPARSSSMVFPPVWYTVYYMYFLADKRIKGPVRHRMKQGN